MDTKSFVKKNIYYVSILKHRFIPTINDYEQSFVKYSKHNIIFIDLMTDLMSLFRIESGNVIIFGYSCVHPLITNKISTKVATFLQSYNGLKICIPQDEYYHTNNICSFLKNGKINIVFTCMKNNDINKIYGNLINNIKFINVLTGYVPEFNNIKDKKLIKNREISIFYRGRKLHYKYGVLGHLKYIIAVNMEKWCNQYNIKNYDIYTGHNKKIYGDKWLKTMGNSKITLASPSGTNVICRDTTLLYKINKHYGYPPNTINYDNYDYNFEEAKKLFNIKEELDQGQISPKMFEAILMKTALVMYEGKYSDILKPNIHFIEIKRDNSNIEEVMKKIKDDDFLQNMVDKTYEEIIESGKYSYKKFIEIIDNEVDNFKFIDNDGSSLLKNKMINKLHELTKRRKEKKWQI